MEFIFQEARNDSHAQGLVGLLAVVAFIASPAVAQVQTGSILVRAADEQGGMMPGVTVTISSPVLVSGQMAGMTDAGGIYRFPSLSPGIYSVKLEMQGFQTLVRENIMVLVGQTTPLDFSLKLANVAETITVAGSSPTVDTTSANVSVNLSEQLLQGTPGGRDIWALLEHKVPGLVMSRPDVGGTQGGLQGVYSARGTTSAQNSQFLNGVNVGDPAAIGAAGYYYDFDAFDDIQVSTGAHDISVPTSGVFLNMVTKSGSDRWLGKGLFTWEGDATQGRNIDNDLLRFGFRPQTNEVDYVSDVNVQAGGPLIRNKLRVFGSFRDWRVHVNVPVQLSQSVLDQTNITSGLVNLGWQINQDNRLTGFYSRQRYSKPNRLLNAASITVPESTVDEEDMFNVYQALWNSIITSRLFMDARIGYHTILFPTYQNGTDQSLTDNSTGIVLRNFPTEDVRHRNRLQANATFNYYLDQALGGRHEFRFGFDHGHAPVNVETTRVDDLRLFYSSTTGAGQTVELHGTPLFTRSAVDVTALFAQDSYSLKRLTLIGGVRWERLEGYLPEQSSPASQWFPAIQRSFPEQRDLILWHTAGPRISGIYDLSGNGMTALKASAGRYYYVIPSGGLPLGNVNPNATYLGTYTWNDANGDLHFQAGEQTGTPVITSGTTTTINPDIRRPYTDEFAAGVDRQLIPDLKLSVVFTYRRERFPLAQQNPASPYAATTTTAVDPGLDGVVGTADDGTYQFFQRLASTNPRLVTNDPNSRQTYKGLEITATKRFSNRWQMLAGYTRSKNRIEDVSVHTSPNLLINANGPISSETTSTRTGPAFADRPISSS